MNDGAWDVARYRLRATFRRRIGGYVALTLLVGMLGGIALASLAGARRTESSYPAFLASTNPSDLSLETASLGPGSKVGYDAGVVARLRSLPHVRTVANDVDLNALPLAADGTVENVSIPVPGSVDGLYFDEDRVTITRGRRADPARRDEVVVSADVARHLHLRVGSVMSWAVFDDAQNPEPGIPAAKQHPHVALRVHVVGIGVLNNAIVQDDIDVGGSTFVLFTPAFTRPLTQCCAQNTETAMQFDGGRSDTAVVEREIARVAPKGAVLQFSDPVISLAKAQRSITPDAVALAVFGVVAALAALIIGIQIVSRQLGAGASEVEVLRAIGAGPLTTATDGLFGIAAAVIAGALLAAVIAVVLSPLAPIGPVRPVYPSRGIAFDGTVLGFGMLVLVVVIVGMAVLLARRGTPDRVARRSRGRAARPSVTARRAADAGFSAPAVTGIRFALQRGVGRNSVPMRSAVFGTALATVVVVSSLVFGASLHALVSRPRLYGWNWTYELTGGGSVGAIPQQRAATLLDADPAVAAWSPVYYYGVRIDGHDVPLLGERDGATVAPPVLSGRGLEANDEIVLGAVTLAELHKHLGDTVRVTNGLTKPTSLRIVGTATMPTIGIGGAGNQHLTMGSGALLAAQLMAPAARDLVGNVPQGPEGILVRVRPGVDHNRARRSLATIAHRLTLPTNYGVELDSVQRPAEIVNYRSTTATPRYLGGAIAVGAIVALGLTLVASVRRRRRDVALLKTIGFTRRQIAAVIAWQSTVAVGIGVAVGVPLGIIAGRLLWDRFATAIHAVPDPIVPVLPIALLALGGLVLANVVAAIPAISAAATPPSLLLRSE